jgi:hypothetical protein
VCIPIETKNEARTDRRAARLSTRPSYFFASSSAKAWATS